MMNKIFTFISILIASAGMCPGETETYEVFSEFWPQRVDVSEAIQLPSGTLAKPGKSFILIRVEDGKIVADFGHHGVMRLDPEQTNFDELYEENRLDRTWDGTALFTEHMTRKFFMPETLRQCDVGQFSTHDCFLLVYADVGTDRCAALLDAVDTLSTEGADSHAPEVLLIPLDGSREELLSDLKSSGVKSPVMFHFLAEGYRLAFDHNPEQTPVVLLDKNGRVLEYFREDQVLDVPAFSASVKAAIARLKEERKRMPTSGGSR